MPKNHRPSVFIVTPIFKASKYIESFLQSTGQQSYESLTTIIVDDGSTDGSTEIIAKKFPDVVVLTGTGSLWWSGSTNLGTEYALSHGADYVFTVNVDVTLDQNCIKQLVTNAVAHDHKLSGAMVCDIKDPDQVWYLGGYWDTKKGDSLHYSGSLHSLQKSVNTPDWLTGMGMFINKAVFEKVGSFDAKAFPQYFGDADFSLRAKKAGFELSVEPTSIVYANLQSSWLGDDVRKLGLSFITRALFSKRSQFNLCYRAKFYARNWKLRYLFVFYTHFTKDFVVPVVKHQIKKLLRREGTT